MTSWRPQAVLRGARQLGVVAGRVATRACPTQSIALAIRASANDAGSESEVGEGDRGELHAVSLHIGGATTQLRLQTIFADFRLDHVNTTVLSLTWALSLVAKSMNLFAAAPMVTVVASFQSHRM